jgi:branched-chain amino acid transport system permease protein
VYFSIATLCLAVVLHTLVVNWDYVGGSRGAYIVRPREVPPFVSYGEYLFVVMLALAILTVGIARAVEHSRIGRGLQAIRDNERAAEAVGVPTLRLKLVAATLCGALMGVAGAPLPYYSGYLNPEAAFGLAYAVNAIAMPLIGGAGTWAGPVIGAVLLGALQQAATVTISSALNLWIVGWMLVVFVALAPRGIMGWFRRRP